MSTLHLPTLNASLNATATVMLLLGWIAAKKYRVDWHRGFMMAALIASAAFLGCYLYYHATEGSTPYQGEGALRMLYFIILFTHIPLAGLMVPFILAAVWFAFQAQIERHTRITKWLWPVWMYVSVTGVVIYVMLY